MNNKLIFSGLKWASIQLVIDSVVKFSIRIILAKLLSPEEFGLIGMSIIFIGLAQSISELGMGAALIQKKDSVPIEKYYSTTFWTSIFIGIIIYSIFSFIVAPLASKFYNEPVLITVIAVMCICLLLKPFTLISIVILTRELNFKKISKISNFSTIVSGVISLLLAYLGFGVWALILNFLIPMVVAIPLYYLVTKWKPKIEWKKEYFLDIFSFGLFSTGNSLLRTLSFNIDNMMIGKMLGATNLGSYTLAYSLTDQLRMFVSSVTNSVMYPVFGKLQDDNSKLKNYFLTIVKFNSILIFPIMSILILYADDIILNIFGEIWKDAIIPLKILSLAIAINMTVNSFDTLIRGKGKPQLEMKIMIFVTIIILIPSLFFGIKYFDLIGAAGAILFSRIVLVITVVSILKKEIDLKLLELVKSLSSSLLAILVGTTLYCFILFYLKLNKIFIAAPVFIFAYVFVIYFLEKKNIKKIVSGLK